MHAAAIHEAERSSLQILSWPCLLLNADYRPISTFPISIKPVRKAIENVIKDKVDVVEEWGGAFRSARLALPIPKVVVLRQYAPVYGAPKFCRRSILLRDRFCCQYCGHRFESAELTFDHVVPRAEGGQTVWENIVAACIPCNARKGARPANYSGRRGAPGSLRPLKEPRQPSSAELLRNGLEFLSDQNREDFGSWLYWTAELKA